MSLFRQIFKSFKKLFKQKKKKRALPNKIRRGLKKKLVRQPKKKLASSKPVVRKKIQERVPANKGKKLSASAKVIQPKLSEILVGEITHFFSRIQVGVIKMNQGELTVGESIHIKGKGVDFIQKIDSLQIESINVKNVRKGQLAGLKVAKVTQKGDKVYKIVQP